MVQLFECALDVSELVGRELGWLIAVACVTAMVVELGLVFDAVVLGCCAQLRPLDSHMVALQLQLVTLSHVLCPVIVARVESLAQTERAYPL